MEADVASEWQEAERYRDEGRIHEAAMGFLRVKALLRTQCQSFMAQEAKEEAGRESLKKMIRLSRQLVFEADSNLDDLLAYLSGNAFAALLLPMPLPNEFVGRSSERWKTRAKCNYRKLCLRVHPDKNPGLDTSKLFSVVQHAYELLNDASEMSHYQPREKEVRSALRTRSAAAAPKQLWSWRVRTQKELEGMSKDDLVSLLCQWGIGANMASSTKSEMIQRYIHSTARECERKECTKKKGCTTTRNSSSSVPIHPFVRFSASTSGVQAAPSATVRSVSTVRLRNLENRLKRRSLLRPTTFAAPPLTAEATGVTASEGEADDTDSDAWDWEHTPQWRCIVPLGVKGSETNEIPEAVSPGGGWFWG